MAITVDINSDLGERPEALADGSEEKLIRNITSANIACGGHAGDDESMLKVMKICSNYGVGIGAHPSYPNKESFGRVQLDLSIDEIADFVYEQVSNMVNLASKNGFEIRHIKPHGALYNSAVYNKEISQAIALGVKKISKDFILFGLAGTPMLDVWHDEGFTVAGEAFADRSYEPNGTLRSRKFPDALITDPQKAAQQALRIVTECKIVTVNGSEIIVPAETICLHSDTENSDVIAAEVRRAFMEAGVNVKTFNP
jgi:5-oxoprolinase (ATP-hydrolysing) subunit A